jgi:hypothetical protein
MGGAMEIDSSGLVEGLMGDCVNHDLSLASARQTFMRCPTCCRLPPTSPDPLGFSFSGRESLRSSHLDTSYLTLVSHFVGVGVNELYSIR